MAACRLAAKGKTMADASYDAEVKSILAFLAMQKPAPAPAINPSALDIQPDDYVAPRFVRKLKNKVINTEHCPMSIGLVSVSLSLIYFLISRPQFSTSFTRCSFLLITN
jgi:hypothetical protein